eukprot:scpid104189/ scgid18371/ 
MQGKHNVLYLFQDHCFLPEMYSCDGRFDVSEGCMLPSGICWIRSTCICTGYQVVFWARGGILPAQVDNLSSPVAHLLSTCIHYRNHAVQISLHSSLFALSSMWLSAGCPLRTLSSANFPMPDYAG